jgi:hypothetical protein
MITFRHKGDFKNTERFFENVKKGKYFNVLNKYGQIGVSALAAATPRDSGLTAASWTYKVSSSGNMHYISWSNSNLVGTVSIAIILQYGHGTKSGTFVQGRDYINPAMRSVFDKIADGVWEEVKKI